MLSTVIPVYNEAASLDILYRELVQVAVAQGYELDIIFVDDGSTDGSWDTIRRLAPQTPGARHPLSPKFRQVGRPRPPGFRPPLATSS